ncbi:reticulocalbin-2-like [Apostichopus japonicus]|uniref:reticulocalbin-2-like n=1 Tax=Stichopus japonicus TaxID=307972 RepID=UPI003AB4072B
MINRITVLCITALFAHSLGANLNHEDVKTFDMFPQHYHDGGQHDPEFDHTAFLGGIKAAEEFEHLHEPQAKEQLAKIIHKVDYNKNGVVEKEELVAHLRESLRKIDVEAAEWQFGEADKDKNSLVSKEEYMEYNFGYMKDEEREEEQTQEYMTHAGNVFEAADRDKDGQLSRHEYLCVHNPSNSQETEKVELEYIIGVMDLDKDGAISFLEWLSEGDEEADFDLEDPEEKQFLDEERLIFEEEVDHNRDGYARGFQELVNVIRPQYHFEAKDEAEHLIELADADTNDELTYQEILDRLDLFAGSIESHKGVFHHEDEL